VTKLLDAKHNGSYKRPMNKLDRKTRAQILHLLCEGQSIRAVTRLTGCSKNTVAKLLISAGHACAAYQDKTLRKLPCKRVQMDEIWSFVYAKAKNVKGAKAAPETAGDVWTWTAICADTKLVPSWLVGERSTEDCIAFMADLKSRLANRVQLSTDGHKTYWTAIGMTFGRDVDWAIIEKQYGTSDTRKAAQSRYSPAVCTGIKIKTRRGDPDRTRISTSYVERQNLTMRMGMRRFTRLTNGFSKKVENLAHAVSLHYLHYNFARVHSSLTITREDGTTEKQTPAMAAGIADHIWTLREIAALLDSATA
jgi:IS1 family transposase